MIDKRKNNLEKNSDFSSLFIRGSKVPNYNFSDMQKKDNNNDFSKKDLRGQKK